MTYDSIPDQTLSGPAAPVEDEGVSELLPGATAMKQRMGSKPRRELTPPPDPPKKRSRPKLDVIEAARQHREAEDRAAVAQLEEDGVAFRAVVDGMDLSRLQDLAIIEEMPLRRRDEREQSTANGSQWDERWNGRQNFKKFRRKGDSNRSQRRVQAVIVPVEEAKRKDFGMGNEYWANSTTTSRRDTSVQDANDSPVTSQIPSRTPSQPSDNRTTSRTRKRSRTQDSDSDDGLRFRFRRRRQR